MPLEAGNVYPGHYRSRLDGDDGKLWEPVWRVRVPLLPVEQQLLASPPVRRLHFLHLSGPAYVHTHYTSNRWGSFCGMSTARWWEACVVISTGIGCPWGVCGSRRPCAAVGMDGN